MASIPSLKLPVRLHESLDNSAMEGTRSSESERPERSELCMDRPFLRSTDNPKLEAIAETEQRQLVG